MRAAIFKAVGVPLAIETVDDPQPRPGEVVIKVCRCGVCGTDLHSTSGHGYSLPPGASLGHEYAGEVVEVGAGVEGLRAGDRVAGLPVVGCGACDYCLTGIDVLCRTWKGYGAGMAEYARVSARGATRLPASMSLADGALVEPFAVGRRGVRLANPSPESRVLVIGPGPIGLATLFWLRRLGVRNIAILAATDRRRGLAEAMGADHFMTEGETVPAQLHAALGGMPDIVFEAAGMPGVIARAVDLIRPQGMIVSLGFCSVPDSIVPAAALMKDIAIRFSITYTREDFAACAEALDEDGDRARAMVTNTVSLDAFPLAFEALRNGGAGSGKLLVDPWMA